MVEQELQQNPVLEEVPEQELDLREKSSAGGEDEVPTITDFAEPPEDVKYDSATEKSTSLPSQSVRHESGIRART